MNEEREYLLDRWANPKSYVEGVRNFEFAFSSQCNLTCKYCGKHNDSSEDYELSYEDLTSLIDRIMLNRVAPITFMICGGEPFLHEDLFKSVYTYAMETYGSLILNFSVRTNLTLLPGSLLAFLKAAPKILIQTSLYGSESCNEERVFAADASPSFATVVENIEIFLTECGPSRLSVSVALDLDNVEQLPATVEFLYSLGVRNIFLDLRDTKVIKDMFKLKIQEVSSFVVQHQDLGINLFKRLASLEEVGPFTELDGEIILHPCPPKPLTPFYELREFAYNFHQQALA